MNFNILCSLNSLIAMLKWHRTFIITLSGQHFCFFRANQNHYFKISNQMMVIQWFTLTMYSEVRRCRNSLQRGNFRGKFWITTWIADWCCRCSQTDRSLAEQLLFDISALKKMLLPKNKWRISSENYYYAQQCSNFQKSH